ncbi:hypothetical protein Tco_0187691, partial [Tanacetum coccineum]
MPQEDEILPAKEQPLHTAASPTADSLGYVPESDPKEELDENDEDPEEDPADYPADRDDDDEEEEEPSGDDANDEDKDEDKDEDEEEEEEHPTPADSVPPVHRMIARISIRDEPSISLPPREEIPSPPLPALPLESILPASPPASPIRPLGYLAAMIRLRAEAASTSHSLPLQPLHLLSIDCREDRPKVCLPSRKRLCSTQGPRYDIRKSSAAAAARLIGGCRED